MGLDLLVLGKPKPGLEPEFASTLDKLVRQKELIESEKLRFLELVIPPFETLNAPRVGFDSAADEWILKARRQEGDQRPAAQILEENKGFHVLRLLKDCDGVAEYSHAYLYEGLDDTSFRGAFLNDCKSLLDKKTLQRAWTDVMPPNEAISYGQELKIAAESEPKSPEPGFFNKLFGSRARMVPIDEQRKILRSAGKWYVFWGRRGHHIQAYY